MTALKALEIDRLSNAVEGVDLNQCAYGSPVFFTLIESLANALFEKLDPVMKSIENKNLIDIAIWQCVKLLVEDTEAIRGRAEGSQQ